jgi:hypothetical protein
MEENFRLDGSSWYGGIWILSLGSLLDLALNVMWRWNCMDMSCLINYLPRSKCMVYNNTVYKSLTLRGLTPDEKCRKWIRRWLGVGCPNVAEFSLEAEFCKIGAPHTKWHDTEMAERSVLEIEDFRRFLEDGDEVEFEEIWMAKEDHAFTPERLNVCEERSLHIRSSLTFSHSE